MFRKVTIKLAKAAAEPILAMLGMVAPRQLLNPLQSALLNSIFIMHTRYLLCMPETCAVPVPSCSAFGMHAMCAHGMPQIQWICADLAVCIRACGVHDAKCAKSRERALHANAKLTVRYSQ